MTRGPRLRSWRPVDVIAVAAAAFAVGFMGQDVNANSGSHLALVRALADGTPFIEEAISDMQNLGTLDIVRRDGHVYSNKAPGLALVALPAYVALEAAGTRLTGDPAFAAWALGLVAVVLPALLAMVVARALAERLAPGYGTATAVTLGLGTLLFPFGTMLFSHVLSAFLCLAAFAVLWVERERGRRLPLVLAGGFLAGYAVTTEYPNGLVAVVLGFYALGRVSRVRRGLVYTGGFLLGLVPLFAYNAWAFGNPLLLSYGSPNEIDPEELADRPFRPFGLGLPNFREVVELLFTYWGLLWAAPVLALGGFGVVLLYRRGRRAEGVVVAVLAALFLLYNSAFWGPIGGGAAGTRYLIAMIPFLALPVAAAYGRLPLTTGALAAASVGAMTVMTATRPVIAWDGRLLDRLTSADGSSPTLADFAGITGWYDIAPFYAAVLAAVVAAVASAPARAALREVPVAAAALLGWAVTAGAGIELLTGDGFGKNGAALLVLLVALAAVAATAAAWWLTRLQRTVGVSSFGAPN